MLPCRGTSTGEGGEEEPHEFQQEEVLSLAAGDEHPQDMLRAAQLESRFSERA